MEYLRINHLNLILVCDGHRDWKIVTEDPTSMRILDPAAWMLDINGFGHEGNTGVKAVGEFLGLNMDLKNKDWTSETRLTGIRWTLLSC